jgi:hypothetical protein
MLKWPLVDRFPLYYQWEKLVRVTKFKPVRLSSECSVTTEWSTFKIITLKLFQETQTEDLPKEPTTAIPKEKKKIIVKEKDPRPGPASYNLPSMFDRKPTYEPYCEPNQKSVTRYLDSLVMHATKEVNITKFYMYT